MERTDIIIICFLKEYETGYTFKEWPNHITMVHYFWTSDPDKLVQDLQFVCKNFGNINYTVGETVEIGHNKGVKANIVVSEKLMDLYNKVSEVAFSHDPEFRKKLNNRTFLPHVSHNELPYPKEGGRGTIEEIYLVQHIIPNKKEKGVYKKIHLS